MTELRQLLSHHFSLNAATLDLLASQFQPQLLERDDFFARSGAYCEQLSFIKSGHLRVYGLVDGKEITQWVGSPGEFAADLGSLVFKQPARRDIQALTACELYTIHKGRYRALPQLIPEWPEIEKLFIAKCFITLEERVFGFLSMTAEERYLHLFQYKKDLFNQVPLHYLASMMGMTPETLSRIRKKATS